MHFKRSFLRLGFGETDVSAVECTSAFTDPDHVTRQVVRRLALVVVSRQRTLVVKQQRLVAREELNPVHRRFAVKVDPARAHERERLVDLTCNALVTLTGG